MGRHRVYKTNASRQAAYRARKRRPAYFSRKSDEWATPAALFQELDKTYHFDLDPCCTPDNAQLGTGEHLRFILPDEDGLSQPWTPSNCAFVNPPHSQIAQWVKKSWQESRNGVTSVMLIPSRTDTQYWQDIIQPHAAEVRFLRGRLRFGNAKNSAPFPSAIVIFRAVDEPHS